MNDFRYGRDDEELLGLRFCNEVVVAADQIYPPPSDRKENKESTMKDTTEEDIKRKNIEQINKKGENSNIIIQKIESSVKPTNQKVHPTVSK